MTIEELQRAQLAHRPDSHVFLRPTDVLRIGASDPRIPPEFWRWVAIGMSYMEYGPIQFYLCGLRVDGRYQNMGMRYGLEPHEYMSGCPAGPFLVKCLEKHA